MKTPRRDTNGTTGQTLSVAEIASRYGVSLETVADWIRAGELKAVNVSRSRHSKKPRWRITPEGLTAFEAARAATPEPPPAPKRRKRLSGEVIEFYT